MKNLFFAFLAMLLFASQLNAGGPWPTGKGKAYIKLSEWWTVFDEHFTDLGRIDPNTTSAIYNTFIYTEYGLTDRFTAIVNVPLVSRSLINNVRSLTTNDIIFNGDAITSFGDVELGLKYNLSKYGAKIPIAVTLTLGIPTGQSIGGELNNLQTGDGEFNQILTVDAGTGFNIGDNVSGYVSGVIGINNRSQGFSEEFRYGAEVGIGLFNNRFWLSGKLNAIESFKNSDRSMQITSTSIFANNTEFITLGLEANVYVTEKFGVSAGFANVTRGEIIAAAPAYNVGVFLDIK